MIPHCWVSCAHAGESGYCWPYFGHGLPQEATGKFAGHQLILNQDIYPCRERGFWHVSKGVIAEWLNPMFSCEPLGTTGRFQKKLPPSMTVIPVKGRSSSQISCRVQSTASTVWWCWGCKASVDNLKLCQSKQQKSYYLISRLQISCTL